MWPLDTAYDLILAASLRYVALVTSKEYCLIILFCFFRENDPHLLIYWWHEVLFFMVFITGVYVKRTNALSSWSTYLDIVLKICVEVTEVPYFIC